MFNIKLVNNNIADIKANLEIIFIKKDNFEHRFIQDKKLITKIEFKAYQDETLLLIEKDRLYVGVDNFKSSNIRTASAVALRSIINKDYETIKIAIYLCNEKCFNSVKAMVEGIILGSYLFEKYKTQKTNIRLSNIIISHEEYNNNIINTKRAEELINDGKIIGNATNFTRDIVNTTPEDCYPKIMADIAKKISKNTNLKCKILKTDDLKKENMQTLLAVGRASRHKSRLIHLSHIPKNAKTKISLVGKGLTYDSGGLSLKPSEHMVTMKADKSGGSAVLGIMQAVAELNLPIEVHGFIGAVENMIGGDAYKPDDVLISKSGKTIEVRNTDAEGRLVLADVLAYAQQEVKADYIIDLATLTGACVVGVGEYTTGVMGNCEKLKDTIIQSAKTSGELATKLDFNRYLAKTIKSKIADICNISSSRYGGSITAGQFLNEFIREENKNKWIHLDIAGPAFVEHIWGENPYGASGAGVRMVIKALELLNK